MLRKEMQINITKEPEKHPIAKLVQEASRFSSSIFFEYKDKNVNAKSIMGMMTFVGIMKKALESNDKITLSVDGSDENDALKSMSAFFE
ncbi:MAG: HPr family phosphocarrier protein [Lachnospiraceae bacterium]|nr:HPr family phosphocarrier protein [Lachnospiraceae bacterium]